MFLIVAVIYTVTAQAEEMLVGRVIAIKDGDTLIILTADKTQVTIRLAEIDTPEKGQPYSTKAKQALSAMAYGKTAAVIVQTEDRYGRLVGRVYVNALDVNAAMVRNGHAFVYRRYAKDENLYHLEQVAIDEEIGLWALPEVQRVPPWTWRKLKRSGQSVGQVQQKIIQNRAATAVFECGTKRYCKEMASCEEAKLHLTQCGRTTLDRDKDGIPCETLCP